MRSPKLTQLMSAFALTLKAARHHRGLSQDQLAASTGVARTYIARIELGHNQPTISVLFHLAKALDVTPEDLIEQTRQRYEKSKQIQAFISPLELASRKQRQIPPTDC